MRIHVLPNSVKKTMCRYELRKNPRKTWKLMEKEIDMLSSKCGEKFGSWGSLFKQMKFHSDTEGDELSVEVEEFEEKEMNSNSSGSYEEGGDGMETQSYSEVTAIESSGSLDSLMAYENEEMAGAFCLMMLSRAAVSVTDSSDKVSAVADNEVEKDKSNSGFPQCDSEMNELAVIPSAPKFDFGIDDHKKVQSFPSESRYSHKQKNSKAPSYKKDKYKCKECFRTFPTHQALGGHMASHKKIKAPSFSKVLATKVLNIQNHGSRIYECSIWGKTFASGQALGGHKRSHLVAVDNAAPAPAPPPVQSSPPVNANMEQTISFFGVLDLNLSYDDYDDMIEDSIWFISNLCSKKLF